MSNKLVALAVCGALVLSVAGDAAATTITLDNGDVAAGSIGTFGVGVGDSATFGQVFTAPLSGRVTSFTLRLIDGVGSVQGAIGTWNGGPVFGLGFGSPMTLYVSAPRVSSGAEAFTFTPNVPVVAGQQYVAFLTVFGNPDASSLASFVHMPMSDNSIEGIDYFVRNGQGSPYGNPSWDYSFSAEETDLRDAQFSATFATPEPDTLALLCAGLVGLAARRRPTRP